MFPNEYFNVSSFLKGWRRMDLCLQHNTISFALDKGEVFALCFRDSGM